MAADASAELKQSSNTVALSTREHVGAWRDSWHESPKNVSERAATELMELIEPPAIDGWTNLAVEARHQIVDTLWSGQLSDIAWIRSLFVNIESLLNGAGNLDNRASELLVQLLGSMGADGFVDMIEDRTRPSLDWIQFNGAVLGAVLGAVARVLTVLAHALR